MTKSTAAKGCICLGILLLLTAGGILAWVFVGGGGDDTSQSNSEQGGLFGTGIFAGNDDKTNGTFPVAPTAAPSARPTVYEYPFDQCSSNSNVTCCNGLENLCDWPVNEILFGAVHNAMATADAFLVPNHQKPVSEALERGFRGINLDVCNCQGVYTLCHGVCGLGEADPLALVGDIVTFLQENPNEVVLLTLELNSNAGQAVDLNEFDTTVLSNIEGFHDALYVHADTSVATTTGGDDDDDNGDLAGGDRDDPWPTLRKLIEDDKRLLVFHLNGPTCREGESSCPKGLHYYFEYFQESEFQFETVEEILDVENSCLVTRGAGTSTGVFFAVNNFVTAQGAAAFLSESPPEVVAQTVNARDFASERIQSCAAWIQEGSYRGEGDVNVMFVDYWSVGDMIEVVQEHNRELGTYSERQQR